MGGVKIFDFFVTKVWDCCRVTKRTCHFARVFNTPNAISTVCTRVVFRKTRQSHSKSKLFGEKEATTTKAPPVEATALVETKREFLKKVSKRPRRNANRRVQGQQQ